MLTLILAAALSAAQAPPAVQAPDTAAGRALAEFVETFNAGGDRRRAWVQTRTTMDKDNAEDILKADEQILGQHGPLTIARIAKSTETSVVAIVRHAKSGAHGHLTIDVEPAAPNRVTNVGLRGATPEEIKGGAAS